MYKSWYGKAHGQATLPVVTGPIVTPTLFTPPVPDDTVVPVPDGGAPVPAGV